MRFLGNKTKLLGEIEDVLSSRGVRSGTFIDIFSGTSSVGKHFKKLGFRVIANDQLSACYSQAVAHIEVSRCPDFSRFRKRYAKVLRSERFRAGLFAEAAERGETFDGTSPKNARLLEAIRFLDRELEPRDGFIYRNFSPGGAAGRMYFTESNARKADAILEFLRDARGDGVLTREEFHLLLVSLIDGVDRVANISGTYGAYLKNWQRSSLAELRLTPIEIIESPLRHEARRGDAVETARAVRGDVLYVDPPYNSRQYPANYHVLEIIAEFHRIDDLHAYEDSLYGRTGLRPWSSSKSAFCCRPGSGRAGGLDARQAMASLVANSEVRHIVISYNEEGLLDEEDFGEILAEFQGSVTYDAGTDLRRISYKRFRSDRDRAKSSDHGGRSYRVLDGRRRDEIAEWIFYARRESPAPGRTRRN
jgi:adenine-specific DNA-methyltransferase